MNGKILIAGTILVLASTQYKSNWQMTGLSVAMGFAYMILAWVM